MGWSDLEIGWNTALIQYRISLSLTMDGFMKRYAVMFHKQFLLISMRKFCLGLLLILFCPEGGGMNRLFPLSPLDKP